MEVKELTKSEIFIIIESLKKQELETVKNINWIKSDYKYNKEIMLERLNHYEDMYSKICNIISKLQIYYSFR